jgi:RND superfamily putative drug exporter
VIRFAEAILRHRRLVALFWATMTILGLVASGRLADELTAEFAVPGQPGYDTEQEIVQAYGQGTAGSLVGVVTVPEGTHVEASREAVAAVFDHVREEVPQVRVTDYGTTSDPALITDDGRTTFGLIYQPPVQLPTDSLDTEVTDALNEAAEREGFETGLTGYDLLARGDSEEEGVGVLAETLLGALGALAVLAFVFASFLALVPLLVAAVAILSTFLIVLGMTVFTDVSLVVQFLVALVGLGVAIDYSLLLVTRWREERSRGTENHEAVVTAVRTAGHAVLASGFTVAISLIALLVVPVPWLQSMGLGGMLIPLVSAAVVVTLLPVLLSKIGPRIDWPRVRSERSASRGWTAWTRMVLRRPWIAGGIATVLLCLMAAPVFGLKIGNSDTESLARSGPAYEALQTLEQGGVEAGVLTPMEVAISGDDAAGAEAAAAAAAEVDGVRTALPQPSGDGLTVIDVIPEFETVDTTSNAVVDEVHQAVDGTQGFIGIAGSGAVVQDYLSAVYDNMPYVLALIAVITYVLLARTFRSLILPLQAVLLNLLSVAAVFGVTVFFWQEGSGSEAIYDISATGAIPFWIPVLIFAFLFGLSMDYEVFILSRMREEYDETGSTNGAVVTGLGRTGRLVTSAALILFFAFVALSTMPVTEVKIFATALGVGILIDATLVRALLVPALVAILGRWNWWLPVWAARILRVPPSPATPERAEPPTPEPAEGPTPAAVR